MTESVKSVIAFVLGAAASAVALNHYYKKKYSDELDVELANTRAYYEEKYGKKNTETTNTIPKAEKNDEKIAATENRPKPAPIKTAQDICTKAGYIDYSRSSESEDPNIEYITPAEYGNGGYDYIELTWREASRTMVDDGQFRFDNWEERVGANFLAHMGEYIDESCYVRNHELKTDYLIELEVDEERNAEEFDW